MKNADIWSQLSRNWMKWSKEIYRPRELLHQKMGVLAELKSGAFYMDFGTGMGEPCLTIQRQYPSCSAVGVDTNQIMLDLAQERATQLNINGVKFQLIDSARLPFADQTFDALVCCFGLEYVTDLGVTLSEMRRVLKPGARIVLNVWGKKASNAVQTVSTAALASLGIAPSGPNIFCFEDPSSLTEKLFEANLEVEILEPFEGHLVAPRFEEYWSMQTETSPLIFTALNEMPADRVELARLETLKNCGEFIDPDGQVRLPFQTWLVAARKQP